MPLSRSSIVACGAFVEGQWEWGGRHAHPISRRHRADRVMCSLRCCGRWRSFRRLSVSIAYVLILAAICGSVILLLAVIATADRVNQLTRKEPRK